MSDDPSGGTGQGRGAQARRRIRSGARFVADTVRPESAGLSRGKRLATYAVALLTSAFLVGLGLARSYFTAGTEARIGDDAQSALDAEKGYLHAAFRPLPRTAYGPPYSAFSRTPLTPRQIDGVHRGEYDAAVLRDSVAASGFGLRDTAPGNGQVNYVDLVSDSSSIITVTGIAPTHIRCRNSAMVAEIHTPAQGDSPIKGLAFELEQPAGAPNGFITDSEDPHRGEPYFAHHTVPLGGAAPPQTLSVLGVAPPGRYCTWDLAAQFTTDDGTVHHTRLNAAPLVTEGGPGTGPGTQHLQVDLVTQIRWRCEHGLRRPEDCGGVFRARP
ncbi:hypothetical protein [Streptomyces catenulae]|uniref:Uncharacterized protein n=1 Tax=Streptomyces catenulae TaxID=66875 RepID=A0ABV2YSY5_9ACTN|nr:hypothetical protein [Streptomyces catenulae]